MRKPPRWCLRNASFLALLLSLNFALPCSRSAAQEKQETVAAASDSAPSTPPPVAPQQTKSTPGLGKRFLLDQKAIWTSPAQFKVKDLRWALPLAGLTGASIAFDPEIAREIVRSGQHAKTFRRASDAGVLALGGLAVAQYGFGRIHDDDHLRESGTLALEAMFNSFVVTEPMALITARERPLQGSRRGNFFSSGQSFPSSHSSVAWAAASVIAHEYPGWLTQSLVYGIAAGTSLSRVAGQKHWLSDVLIGSATGYLVGRQVYGLHHDSDLGGANWGTFQTRHEGDGAPVIGSTYVPLDSWVYPLFDRIAAMGYITSQQGNLRPWTRQECFRLVREAEDNLDDAADPSAAAILATLRTEFRNEDHGDAGLYQEAALESVYTRALAIGGPELRESYHYGETITNDYGRPYGEGANFVSGFSARAVSGRYSLYVRGEYQHSASSATLPLAARQFIALADNNPTVPAGEFPSVDRVAFQEAYVSIAGGGFQLSAGKQSLWWGPGRSGPLLFSNNAEPVYMLRVTRPTSFRLPGSLAALGSWNLDFFFGGLSGYQHPRRPLFHGERITWKPTDNLELGFTRTTLWGGAGEEPFTWRTFFRTYTSVGDNLFSNLTRSDPGDRRGGFDFSYRLPKLRNWVTLYSDSYVDDDPSPFANPPRAAFSPGIYLPRLPHLHNLEFRAEAPYSDTPDYSDIPFGAGMYWNQNYRDGYTNHGKLIGSWVGRRTIAYQGWLTYWVSAQNKIELNYRNVKQSTQYLPGGGTQHDLALRTDWRVRPDLAVSSTLQYENWLIPLLSPNRQQDWTGMVQLTFFPSKILRRSVAR